MTILSNGILINHLVVETASLLEAKSVGIVYHFTTDSGIKGMIKSGFDVFSNNGVFSMSRNKSLSSDLFPNTENHFTPKSGYIIRLKIDGNKMSNEHSIKPLAGLIHNGENPWSLNWNTDHRVKRKSGESEEGISLLKNNQYNKINIRKYIICIDVYSTIHSNPSAIDTYNQISEPLHNMNIQCNLIRHM